MTKESAGGGASGRLERLIRWPAFTGDEWQLPTQVPGAERLLLGWRFTPEPVDEGPPRAVAKLVAAALGRHATLIFASATRASAGGTLSPARWRLGENLVWTTSASDDEAVEGIFYADFFTWSLQGQVVILGTPGVPLRLDERYVQLQNDARLFAELEAAGAQGVLLPGVDGAVAGLYFFNALIASAVSRELEDLARAAGGACVVAGGEAFGSQLRR